MSVTIQPTGIVIKSAEEIATMRRAGQVVAKMIEAVSKEIRPGVTTADLDAVAYQTCKSLGAKPGFKGYHGYPATICTSVNNEIVHGIPNSKKVLKEGDIVSIDVGAIVDGFNGDAARTLPVGKVTPLAEKLMRVTRESLDEGIKQARAKNRMGDIGAAIQKHAESNGFSIVREYVGHGIGRLLHEEPAVPNYGEAGKGMILPKSLCIAIEPMVNIGSWETRVLDDKWTVVTKDGSLSAHFEDTLVITDGQPEVLTRL